MLSAQFLIMYLQHKDIKMYTNREAMRLLYKDKEPKRFRRDWLRLVSLLNNRGYLKLIKRY